MLETLHSKTIQQLMSVYQELERRQDEVHSSKLLDVMRKVYRREWIVAFCGHFSAGKSTMLNALYGKDLLPTGPIPTSANVVEVRSGADRVVLSLRSGERYEYSGEYSGEELKRLCKNGDEVIGVQVFKNTQHLPKGVVLMDTPGIDSTDDDHRMAAESALHLADVIFYMMDYNHVQSEENLQFIKELKQRGKQVFPVIHQIDKHRDSELSFEKYRENVEASFRHWGIPAMDLFFTTLHQPDHPFNQLNGLKACIQRWIQEREERIGASARKEAEYLIREHLTLQETADREVIRSRTEALGGGPVPPLEELEAKYDSLKREKESLLQERDRGRAVYLSGVEEILRNAYLMPYEVREAGERYLETVLTDFKVGWFFSKRKTAKERDRRLGSFFDKLKKTVDTQLDFHIKQYGVQFLKQNGIYTETLAEQIYRMENPLTPDLLQQAVKSGAGMTGNYLLKYTDDLVGEIQKSYRRQAESMFSYFAEPLQKRLDARLHEVENQLESCGLYRETARWIAESKQRHETYSRHLFALLRGEKEPDPDLDLSPLLTEKEPVRGGDPAASFFHRGEAEVSATAVEAPGAEESVDISEQAIDSVEGVLSSVRICESSLKGLKGFEAFREELSEKRRRVENRRFTAALFGAFSAGKTFFANALIGEKMLPVSPNPTTAAINRIAPPTDQHRHGEGMIRFKSREVLFQDLNQVYRLFQTEANSLEEALQGIDDLLSRSFPSPRQQAAFPFLRAVQAGYSAFADCLGMDLTLDAKALGDYVADEGKACFIEEAVLYVDTPLTESGVTLVDTPGADSIHARHTEVAFQYMKKADAVLFVTYYNHAFSRADREFLIQLGRVKDIFSMDKMFFIMNAADLASSREERKKVEQYIREQLVQYGIRHPRLFPVSSLQALEEKRGWRSGRDSGLDVFEQAFTGFLKKDLMQVSLNGLRGEVERTRQALLDHIGFACQGMEEQERKKEVYAKEKVAFLQVLSEYDARTEEYGLRQEIEELFYYVLQRLFLRYNDAFTEIIHPSAFRNSGGDSKRILKSCLMELMDFVRHDLMQELRATSLRIEEWMRGKLEAHADAIKGESRRINENLSFSEPTEGTYTSPGLETPFEALDVDSFKKALSTFRNSRSFFEKNEKVRMRDEVKKVLENAAAEYMDEQRERFLMHYRNEWRESVERLKERMRKEGVRSYDLVLSGESEASNVADYEKAERELGQQILAMDRLLQREPDKTV
ncbi:dynamin family protein [Paludifilum halophilum]|uniref:Dynamin N-terminal domain-containing protein n=1 Tax=Paludifilum halophilum TaxID=1642702 RepID=A0A235BAX7_9BACL|nr:dynamin family protein [Paludifilum halophilum]OYD09454.1 hypothetical protein CHM34_00035 [Paludifilum halophilum]